MDYQTKISDLADEGTLFDLDSSNKNTKSDNKICKQCGEGFSIEPEDLEFYKKISPVFAGKKYNFPSPILCPRCREIRRLAFRNEMSLYKRKCDKTGKEIISIYSPDKTDYKVYEISEWYKDDWDALEFGRNFDFNRPFFEQFNELLQAVPQISLFNINTENCQFSNYIGESKNCYMSTRCYIDMENSHYCYCIYRSKDNIDLSYCSNAEKCYECVNCYQCFNCRYSIRLHNCQDCYFCADLVGCSNCLFSTNLSHKQYYIENKSYTKKEYHQKLKEYNFGSRQYINDYEKKFKILSENRPVKFSYQIKSENSIGEGLIECKNAKYCYSGYKLEDCKYCRHGEEAENVYDSQGGKYQWVVECTHAGAGTNLIVCRGVLFSSFMYYCDNCHNCHDCFGCVGLQNKQFCIFNKQYTKEEYEKLVGRIIEHMQKTGEWGMFFPLNLSPFGYNETVAQVVYPKTKGEATALKAKWQNKDYSLKYNGPFYKPKDEIDDYIQSKDERDKLLQGIIKCEDSGKPFKIIPQELAFYIENRIAIPTKHPKIRYTKRVNLGVELRLQFYHRQCMCSENNHGHLGRCPSEFETTYSPDRPEKIYCEKCYQKIII